MERSRPQPDTQQYLFGTTHWSNVLGAADRDENRSQQCMECLCQQYWNPVYAYLRRFRHISPVDAEDLTQEFFAYVIEQHVLPRATPELARFRTFLKGVLRNFLSSSRRYQGRLKRGGGKKPHPLNRESDAEPNIPSPDPTPGESFDRDWARQVLELALEELTTRLRKEGRTVDLEIFQSYTLSDRSAQPTYSELAQRLGLTDWEVWNRLSAVREDLRSLMRIKVAETVRDPDLIDEELESIRRLLP